MISVLRTKIVTTGFHRGHESKTASVNTVVGLETNFVQSFQDFASMKVNFGLVL